MCSSDLAELVNLKPAGAEEAGKAAGGSPRDKDELYDAAVEVVIREGRGSVSLLQRALGVGYGRGARLIDYMAEDGVVGQYAGSQAREVLITMEQWAERNGTTAPPPDPAPRRLKIQPHAAVVAPVEEVEEDDEEAANREDAIADLEDEESDADDDYEEDDAYEEDGEEAEDDDADEPDDYSDDDGDSDDD